MRRAGRIVLSILIGLVAAEIGLRIVGFAYLRIHGRGPGDVVTRDGEAILCVGDSNTFGLYLAAEESYPAFLDDLIAEHGTSSHAALNIGIPGMGADHVARDLPGHIAKHRPGIVVCLVGLNNSWNELGASDSALGRFLHDMRLVKLTKLLLARDKLRAELEDEPVVIDSPASGRDVVYRDTQDAIGLIEYRDTAEQIRGGRVFRLQNRAGDNVDFVQSGTRLEEADFLAAIANRLEQIALSCRTEGVSLVLMTYPFRTPILERINATVRELAADLELPLVDLELALAPYVEEVGIEAMAFPDLHPRASGTRVMAHHVYRVLCEEGLIEGAEVPLPGFVELGAPERERRMRYEDGVLVIEGVHGDGAQVVFSTEIGHETRNGVDIGLGRSQLLSQSLKRDALFLGIGPAGEVRLEIPPAIKKNFAGRTVHAVVCFGPQAQRRVDHVSSVVTLEL